MGSEAFAEATLCLLSGWRVEAVEDVDFVAPFKFYRTEPRTLTIEAVIQPQGKQLGGRLPHDWATATSETERAASSGSFHGPRPLNEITTQSGDPDSNPQLLVRRFLNRSAAVANRISPGGSQVKIGG